MKQRKAWLAIGGVAAVLVCVVAAGRLMSQPVLNPAGREIQYDDFGFNALRAESVSRLGSLKANAGREFCLVDIKITNYAKVVNFEYRPEIVKIYSRDGVPLLPSVDGQTVLDSDLHQDGFNTVVLPPNGGTCSHRLVFMIPEGTKDIRVAFSTTGWIGDTLDAIFGGNINILLKVSSSAARGS